jgi:WS/DGAT/MGAT family acyltransferase
MPITDAFWLMMESRRLPMHVGGLNLFTLPTGVDEAQFLEEVSDILSYDGELRSPFAEKIKMGPLGSVGKIKWEEEDELDMDYHIRHSALPRPGRYRELFALVSRLHGTLLDRSRPLWEFHIIEGLNGKRQFATYVKAHHCALDGMGAMHLMNSMFSSDASAKLTESPFSESAYLAYKEKMQKEKRRDETPTAADIGSAIEALRGQLGGAVSLAKAVGSTASIVLGKQSSMQVPFFNVPASPLSTQVTGARRFVAQSWSLPRVRAVGKAFDATINDVVLAMCAGALRRQLQDQRSLPKESLKALAPVSVRSAIDVEGGNAVGGVIADMATNVRDPVKRFRQIKGSMDSAKEQLQQLRPQEIVAYTALVLQLPMLATQLAGLGERIPPYSTIVSNVPGPREQLYWNGARLDGIYPVSIPMDGSAVNFTVVSNYKHLDFGIVACRKSMPHVQRLIDYMEVSLKELEDAAGLMERKAKAKGETKAKAAAKKKAAVKSRPEAKAAAEKPPQA